MATKCVRRTIEKRFEMSVKMNNYGVAIISSELELKPVGNTNVVNFVARTIERLGKGGNVTTVAHFFNFEIWDSAAEYLARNAQKGDRIVIYESTPRQHKWTKDGIEHSKVVFRINDFSIVPYVAQPREESVNA